MARAADPVPDTGVSRNKLKWHSNSDWMFGDAASEMDHRFGTAGPSTFALQ
jgi:hypothetical protein